MAYVKFSSSSVATTSSESDPPPRASTGTVERHPVAVRGLSAVTLIDEVVPSFSSRSQTEAATDPRHYAPNVRTPSAFQDLTESRCRRLGHSHLHRTPEGPERHPQFRLPTLDVKVSDSGCPGRFHLRHAR